MRPEFQSIPETLRSGYRMGLLSIASFLINYGLFIALHTASGVSSGHAAAVSMAVVMTFNFVGCKYYVYRDLRGDSRIQFLRFIVGTLLFRSAEWGVFVALTKWLSLDSVLLYPVVLSVSFLVKYLTYGKLVFNRRSTIY